MSLQSIAVTKATGPFEVKFPAEFDMKPAYVIELPAGRKALLYNTMLSGNEYEDGEKKYKLVPGWRMVVVTRRGTFISISRYEYTGETFTDPLLLNLRIQALAIEYAKKQKTTVEVTDLDD